MTTNINYEGKDISLSQFADEIDDGSDINSAFYTRSPLIISREQMDAVGLEIKSTPERPYPDSNPNLEILNVVAKNQSENSVVVSDDPSPEM